MAKVNVLMIGSGGREHAIVHSLVQSPRVATLYAAPGNAGMSKIAQVVPMDVSNHADVLRFIRDNKIELTVIGPEAPLVAGLSDALRAQGHLVVGASQAAAQLEGSKIFAKNFMAKHNIPTARFHVFDNAKKARDFVLSPEGRRPWVLKADGLAAGKGVIVAKDQNELLLGIKEIMEEQKYGAAGRKVVLEERLSGPEVSLMAFTDGKTILPLPASQDHKRVFNGDKGPNTGGMGAYAPTPFYTQAVKTRTQKEVVERFLQGLQKEKLSFRGIIYFGLMLTQEGPRVLEFNVRLGDPETQAVLPLIASDLYETFRAVARGELGKSRLTLKSGASCTVVMASHGYPGSFHTGFPIAGLAEAEKEGQAVVFHAGTKKTGDVFVTAGGRVLAVTGFGRSLGTAVVRAYQGVKKISFEKAHFRTDIAARALKDPSVSEKLKRMKLRHVNEEALV